ncbi:hypothetical protein [Mycolicibacterium tusciae]|uniref:Uncharacterized protein n=1 Tax=Mycolicibacterium tusciae TaxID=75922 RepID=A0A1X0JWL1_9MYCO|nr:hypothetical protein [Mycolicibacterium tusciae]ORB67162.1 hypothetical protein BST47_07365 [Mycolicibacterium tusciae]
MFDAASRLADGRPAAGIIQDYVWACHLLGYQDPDLTLHASQVRDWYDSEDGIDLQALDSDCEALRAAAAAAEGALARQTAQLGSMSVAWDGVGAQASGDFLRRHGAASAAVVAAVRTAAESLGSLRDRLWHSVDGKVAATMAAEGRGAGPDWQAAAQTVTTGAGDRASASELIDQEVRPFVANDIRSEWLTAMRSAIAAVTDAYDAAAAALASEVAVAFDVPGQLGPSWSPSSGDEVVTVPAGTGSVAGSIAAPPIGAAAPAGGPAAWSTPPAATPPAPTPAPPAEPLAPTAPVEPAAAMPSMPSMPSMGGGMPDIGSGLSGFGGQLGELLGGLMGTSQDALSDLPEPDELDKPDDFDPLDEDEDEDEQNDEEPAAEEPDVDEAEPTATDSADEVVEGPPAEPLAAEAEPVPPPTPVPPPIEPLAAPESAAGTPCEIAADELPQVGE